MKLCEIGELNSAKQLGHPFPPVFPSFLQNNCIDFTEVALVGMTVWHCCGCLSPAFALVGVTSQFVLK